ncbi:unnamed protein product [Pleuronectes platessa]|uniref:Uncharacterized protein n=1 Tax=Pleuronectes platessa TaxID=8262 RepID=A0A9N7UU11_PLEPL|nr:unnamed protein product [Pleuronectes platessa]
MTSGRKKHKIGTSTSIGRATQKRKAKRGRKKRESTFLPSTMAHNNSSSMASISNHKARISTNPKEEEEVGHQEEEEVGHQEAEDVAQETPHISAITVEDQGI